jgi:AcrR family transcriptional regulator
MIKKLQTRQRTEVRRGQIADAARALAVKCGTEHITVRRIAKEIGVSEGALYRHFKSKHDILSLMVERIEEDLVADVNEGGADRTPLQVLEHALQNHVSGIEQRQGVSFQVIAEVVSLGDEKLNRQVFNALERYTGRIRDLLAAGIEAKEIREEVDPEGAALLVASMIQGLVNSWSLSNYGFDLEERYDLLWGILRKALVREDAGSGRRRDALS